MGGRVGGLLGADGDGCDEVDEDVQEPQRLVGAACETRGLELTHCIRSKTRFELFGED